MAGRPDGTLQSAAVVLEQFECKSHLKFFNFSIFKFDTRHAFHTPGNLAIEKCWEFIELVVLKELQVLQIAIKVRILNFNCDL